MKHLTVVMLIGVVGFLPLTDIGTTWAQQPETKKTLAVLPLSPAGISPTEADALTSRLINELIQTNSCQVIERAKVDEILKEQGLGQTGCLTAECVVQAGKMLGVQMMVAGSVGKVGQTYTVEARLVDVETARALGSKSLDYRGEIDGLLGQMRELAQALALILVPPRQFQLRVTATPSDATITIDEQPVGQGAVTRTLPTGPHTVRVTRDTYVPWEQSVQLTQDQTLTATLTPGQFQLRITAPADASVSIDGQPTGQGAVTRTLPTGPHTVRVTKPNYVPWEQSVQLTRDQSFTADLKPIVRFQLRITPAPRDAVIVIDGQPAGQGIVAVSLPGGSHTVRVTKDKYVPWEQTIQLTQNQSVPVNLTKLQQGGSHKWVWGLVGGLIAGGGGAAAAVLAGGKKTAIINPPSFTGVSGSPPSPP